jgi:beta-lactamase class A
MTSTDPVAVTASIRAAVEDVDGEAAVYARHLGDGTTVAVGPVDERFPTGSAAKFLVLLAFADQVERGVADPARRVDLEADLLATRLGSGVLRHLAPGLQPTLQDCATLMMIVSDNVATDVLLDAVGGPDEVNATVARLGAHDVAVTSPSVWVLPPKQFGMASPRGLAEAWSLLATPGPAADRCRAITWRHQQREGFARLVPFAPDLPDFDRPSPLGLWSKAGSYPGVSCEAGLCTSGDSSWVLAVMARGLRDTRNGSAGAGPTLRATVSRLCYEAWRGA